MRTATLQIAGRSGPHAALPVSLTHISDTHTRHANYRIPFTPGGAAFNVLVHSGDFTNRGGAEEFASFSSWLVALPGFNVTLVLCGNHERGSCRMSVSDLEQRVFGAAAGGKPSGGVLVVRPGINDDLVDIAAAYPGVKICALLHNVFESVTFLVGGIRISGAPANHNCGPAFYVGDPAVRRQRPRPVFGLR
jgi:hypothetical protein